MSNPLILPLLWMTDDGAVIENSLRVRASNSAYLSRTYGSAGSTTTATLSIWVKRGNLGTEQGIFATNVAAAVPPYLRFQSDNTLRFSDGAGGTFALTTTQVFRDVGAWYHIVVACDTTQGTAANRIKIYVNGSQITAFSAASYPSASSTISWTAATSHFIGQNSSGSAYLDGLIARPEFVNALQLDPSSFGQISVTTGQWTAKVYAGAYSTNGWRLRFSNTTSTTTLGEDSSGNGNDWTLTNFSVTSGVTYDPSVDVPTNNYATYNALLNGTTYVTTFSEANQSVTKAGGTASPAVSTIGVTTGKWYAEFVLATIGTAVLSRVGVTGTNNFYSSTYFIAGEFDPYGVNCNGVGYFANGTRRINNSDTASWGSTYTTSDVIGVAFDADTGKVWFAKNGTWQASGDPAAGTNEAATLTTGVAFWFTHQMLDSQWRGNFGARPFAYTPPTGFSAMNTDNLSTPSISRGDDYFVPRLRAGSASQVVVSDLRFGTNLLLLTKGRNGSDGFNVADSVRGTAKNLIVAGAAAEDSVNRISAFGTNGYTLEGGAGATNSAGTNYVDYVWKIGVTPGFDIVTYTGNATNRTISHSLGAVPHFMLFKNRSTNNNWPAYHRNQNTTPQNGSLYFSLTDAYAADSTIFNNTAPTSSVFSVGTAANINGNTNSIIAYLWTEIAGFSRFGSYSGNSATDGPFVWCGFRPALVIIKRIDSAGNWYVWDDQRIIAANGDAGLLYAEATTSETDYNAAGIDLVSNGFKLRNTDSSDNGAGTYVFAAFAEFPFKYSNAR